MDGMDVKIMELVWKLWS